MQSSSTYPTPPHSSLWGPPLCPRMEMCCVIQASACPHWSSASPSSLFPFPQSSGFPCERPFVGVTADGVMWGPCMWPQEGTSSRQTLLWTPLETPRESWEVHGCLRLSFLICESDLLCLLCVLCGHVRALDPSCSWGAREGRPRSFNGPHTLGSLSG